ncbi:MAG TPA: hypothetical protein VEA60_13390 [Allosphingosinicella sp.]|nr:hypothetical protein [Allosphingosinicella sp.]
MPRPFTPRQAAQNAAFVEALRRTGNPRLAAASLGVHRSTYSKRRARSAVFATQWDGAVLACHAALKLGGGPRPAEAAGLRTRGGEIIVGRTRGGRLQLRRAPPGRMTEAGEQAFFRALAASANVRLSAAATGFTHSAFYQKKKSRPGFASEMKISLTVGYDRLEYASTERTLEAIHGGGEAWRATLVVGNPLPPMSFDQAFQQLCLHRNSVRLDGGRPPGRPARIAHDPVAAFAAIGRNIDAIERAARYQETGSWRHAHEQAPPSLPPLHLVTGWSRADPARARHNPRLALFGGWRIEDLEKRRRRSG